MNESSQPRQSQRLPTVGRHARAQLAQAANYVTLAIICLVLFIPFVWMLSLALKTAPQLVQVPQRLVPDPFTLENFRQALLVQQPFLLYLRNTAVIAFLVIVGEVFSSTFVAYGFSKLRFPLRDWLFTLLLSTLMVPVVVKLVPLFVIFSQLGWINTFLPLVVPAFFGTPFSIFLMRQFFLTIPNELNEAARIDGASEVDIWWRICVPLARPAIAVVIIFSFQNVWNDFLAPLIYLQKKDVKTVTLGLYNLRGMDQEYQTVMAGAVAVVLPMIVIFLIFQRYFVQGIAVSGLKG